MNPQDGKFEQLARIAADGGSNVGAHIAQGDLKSQLVRADGTPISSHWSVFELGETLELKGNRFRVAGITEDSVILKPEIPTGDAFAELAEAMLTGKSGV